MRGFLTQVPEYCPELKEFGLKIQFVLCENTSFLVSGPFCECYLDSNKEKVCYMQMLHLKNSVICVSFCHHCHRLIAKNYGTIFYLTLKINDDPVFKKLLFCKCSDWFCCFTIPLNRKSRFYISIIHTFNEFFAELKNLWAMNSLNSPLWSCYFT